MASQGASFPAWTDQLSSDGLARVALEGEVLVNTTRGTLAAAFPTAIGDVIFGAVDEPDGADPAFTAQPVRLIRGGKKRIRLQDNATITAGDQLMPSATDAGSVVLAAGVGARPQAIALETISSGTTDQYVLAELHFYGAEFIPVL